MKQNIQYRGFVLSNKNEWRLFKNTEVVTYKITYFYVNRMEEWYFLKWFMVSSIIKSQSKQYWKVGRLEEWKLVWINCLKMCSFLRDQINDRYTVECGKHDFLDLFNTEIRDAASNSDTIIQLYTMYGLSLVWSRKYMRLMKAAPVLDIWYLIYGLYDNTLSKLTPNYLADFFQSTNYLLSKTLGNI